jgi:adenosine deaminase
VTDPGPARSLAALPKAHLHLHLDGAIRERTLRELSAQRGADPPVLPRGKRYPSFDVFMQAITACHDVLSSAAGLSRIVSEVVEDAAADGAVWVEVSAWPGLFEGRLGPERDAVRLVLDAGRQAASRIGIGFGLMVAANRPAGPEAATAIARLAVDLAGDGVVSFGLDGDEAAFPPAAFAGAFAVAKAGGLLSTPHAGELLGPGSVTDALDLLGADRILHGVRAAEDEALVRRLAATGMCLDVCPTSNFKLGLYEPGSHPLPRLLAAGVRCSVNADDPLLFGTSLLQEYELCRTQFSLPDDQLARIAEWSIRASGAPDIAKTAATDGIARWLAVPARTTAPPARPA